MVVFAFDLGTKTGWAVFVDGEPVSSGVFDLSPSRFESPGMRGVKFRANLKKLCESWTPDMVVYEEVHRHLGTAAAHVYGGLLMQLQVFFDDLHVPYAGVAVSHIKIEATGSGNASKLQMLTATRKRFPSIRAEDDNHADALWIGVAGMRIFRLQAGDKATKQADRSDRTSCQKVVTERSPRRASRLVVGRKQ